MNFVPALAVAAILASSPVIAFEGKVVEVKDGDTVGVLREENVVVPVRLASIDAPEKSMAFGQVAKLGLSALVFGKVVNVERRGEDRYGRTIGVLHVNGNNVNAAMVRDGLAWVYCETPKDVRNCRYLDHRDYALLPLMEAAQANHVGLWKDPQPVAPWDWRREQKAGRLKEKSCKDFSTCEEAVQALEAGNTQIDGNQDGVPCEALCR